MGADPAKRIPSDLKRLHGFEYLLMWAARNPSIRRFSVTVAFERDSTIENDWYPLYRVALWNVTSPKITWVAASAILRLAVESALERSGMKD